MVFLSAWNSVMSPAHTDIILQSGGHIVNAHRVVLAPKPHVMQKKLKGNLDRIGTAPMEMYVFPEVLDAFVRYLYTSHISHRDLESNATKLLIAGKRYGVGSLQLIAERNIAKHVTSETALSTWELGVDHDSEIIKRSVLHTLVKDVQDIPKLEEYRTYRCQKDPELLIGLFENLIGRMN
ncbi:uncharacterized protein [Physcomitrium patens]|uniref:uncharacterized protein isoform X1 n=1 Tax=Physcomitrium patens TaxID=3218 RepID=UPI000D16B040|nr:uncharacterized protein LOC112290763 [Physcomitrium patens]XP_024393194.1 uncharacterized protein LOC112290763 [Physcomitrium patens]|eukprot:XP_024393193.1 uncharacterized protein LOC112290763 [Physcomitrella patens]